MLSPTVRAALAFALLSAWLVLLMSGVALAGAVHLLPAAALLLFPWRLLAGEDPSRGEKEEL